jgi:HEPN domain-containing protein
MKREAGARIWLQRAESNLRLAQLGQAEGIFLEDLCFEAQQAAEKSLKAVLIHFSDEYPKVHHLGLLIERLEPYIVMPEAVRAAVVLSNYAVQTRYPGDYTPVSDAEYKQALEHARAVLDWARQQIP